MSASLCYLILGFCGLRSVLEVAEAADYRDIIVTEKTIATTTEVYYAPNPGYDPYWFSGAWVFGTRAETTTKEPTSRPRWAIYKHRILVCGRPCPRIYRKLKGEVCVHKFDNVYDPTYNGYWRDSPVKGFIDWRLGGVMDRNYDYTRTFTSYCEYLDKQCRTNTFHDKGYIFMHMGTCLKDYDAFPNLMYAHAMVESKQSAVKNYAYKMAEIAKPGNRHSPSLMSRGLLALRYIVILGYYSHVFQE